MQTSFWSATSKMAANAEDAEFTKASITAIATLFGKACYIASTNFPEARTSNG